MRFRKIALRKRGGLTLSSSRCSIGSGVPCLKLIRSLAAHSFIVRNCIHVVALLSVRFQGNLSRKLEKRLNVQASDGRQ